MFGVSGIGLNRQNVKRVGWSACITTRLCLLMLNLMGSTAPEQLKLQIRLPEETSAKSFGSGSEKAANSLGGPWRFLYSKANANENKRTQNAPRINFGGTFLFVIWQHLTKKSKIIISTKLVQAGSAGLGNQRLHLTGYPKLSVWKFATFIHIVHTKSSHCENIKGSDTSVGWILVSCGSFLPTSLKSKKVKFKGTFFVFFAN